MLLELMHFWALVIAFSAWLFAEFRGGRGIRVGLGIAWMLLLVLGCLVASFSEPLQVQLHRSCLRQIDRRLKAGEVPEVRRAIQVYNEVYKRNENDKDAVFSLMNALQPPEEKQTEDAAKPPNTKQPQGPPSSPSTE